MALASVIKNFNEQKRETEKAEKIDKIKESLKESAEHLEKISKHIQKPKTIIIETSGGLVTDVKNLPEGYGYDIHDFDNTSICNLCGDKVYAFEQVTHLVEKHKIDMKKNPFTLEDLFEDTS